jgi:hypothetical protein
VPSGRLTAEQRHDIERWFIRRGVPHFAVLYEKRADTLTRAIPILIVAYLLGGLNSLDLANWSAGRNAMAAVVTLAVMVFGWSITNLALRRPFWSIPTRVGPPELVTFVVGPAIPSAIFGQWIDAIQATVEGAFVLLVIWVGVSNAVVPLTLWAVRSTTGQIGLVWNLLVRALPLLLLFTTFLFINAEVWQMAGLLYGWPYPVVIGIFFVLGSVFVLSRVPRIIAGLADFGTWSEVRLLLEDSPAHGIDLPAVGDPPENLSLRERVDLYLLTTFNQAVQITLVALSMFGFFVLLGFLAIPLGTQIAWIGVDSADSINILATVNAGGRELVLSEPLLRVAGFLGAFVGMYFTVVLTTDATYRDEFAEDTAPSTRQLLAVRMAYRWARDLDRPAIAP